MDTDAMNGISGGDDPQRGNRIADSRPVVAHSRIAALSGYRFADALRQDGLSVVAEIKRCSPSSGELCPNGSAAQLAAAYEAGGASCLSILTEAQQFGGSAVDIERARAATSLPILRKDFLRTHKDVYETQAMGADALLLIFADLTPDKFQSMHSLALGLGMDVVAEVRTGAEVQAAHDGGAYLIAVNQRSDPQDAAMTIDYGKAVQLSRWFSHLKNPPPAKVAASGIGIRQGTSIRDVVQAGYDAVLVGEALVTSPDPAAVLRRLKAEAQRAQFKSPKMA